MNSCTVHDPPAAPSVAPCWSPNPPPQGQVQGSIIPFPRPLLLRTLPPWVSPVPPTTDGAVGLPIAIRLDVNGVRCQLFSTWENIQNGAVHRFTLPVDSVERSARRYNGLWELMTVLRLEYGPRNEELEGRVLAGVFLDSNQQPHYLGPLSRCVEGEISAALVESVPGALCVIFAVDRFLRKLCGSPPPAEMLLVQHIAEIIDNDEFCGSVQSSHLQNLVRYFPFYSDGIKRFEKWTHLIQFHKENYQRWITFRYEKCEIENLQLSFLSHSDEVRIVSARFLRSFKGADAARDRVRLEAAVKYRALVDAVTRQSLANVHRGDGNANVDDDGSGSSNACSSRDSSTTSSNIGAKEPAGKRRTGSVTGKFERTLPRLSATAARHLIVSPSFRTLNSVNYLKLLLLAARNEDVYVLLDRLHPIRIDRRRGVTTAGMVATMLSDEQILYELADRARPDRQRGSRKSADPPGGDPSGRAAGGAHRLPPPAEDAATDGAHPGTP